METTIEQQVVMDEALVLSAQRDMLHIYPRIPSLSFVELPFEEEILDFIRFLGHSVTIRTLTDSLAILSSNLVGVIPQEECQLCFPDVGRLCVSSQTQELEEERSSTQAKASARRTRSGSDTSITPLTAAATPRPTAAATPRLTAAAKGKQTAKASKAKSLSSLFEVAITEAQQLKLATRRSIHQTHISQPSGSGIDEGTGSKPGVPDVPIDESEEELSWNSSDDEGADDEGKISDDDEEDEEDDGNLLATYGNPQDGYSH
nr:hypothetical protein [Tanacetum cinerariifolium]